jgi:hypothetical protein
MVTARQVRALVREQRASLTAVEAAQQACRDDDPARTSWHSERLPERDVDDGEFAAIRCAWTSAWARRAKASRKRTASAVSAMPARTPTQMGSPLCDCSTALDHWPSSAAVGTCAQTTSVTRPSDALDPAAATRAPVESSHVATAGGSRRASAGAASPNTADSASGNSTQVVIVRADPHRVR